MSDSLWPHGLQHASLPCPLLSSRVCSNSGPLSQWCHPAISSSVAPPSIFPSIRVFCNESVLCIRWPKYWSFSFSIIPSSKYSGVISFRNEWLDLVAVQGTLKSIFQNHILKASIVWCSAFFMFQLTSVHDVERAGWDELGNWDWHIHTTVCNLILLLVFGLTCWLCSCL